MESDNIKQMKYDVQEKTTCLWKIINQWIRDMNVLQRDENMKVLIELVEWITFIRRWSKRRINEELVNQVPEEIAKCAELEHKSEKELDEMLKIAVEFVAVYITNG
ncbi:unnamed protein product [Adineta steineri]|uniref:Uncharacterized protein n=1 Tax=Adineta steineri TaxID=433720 RepID=A0A814KM62_9BILA|nr:unnamed protein product [Adineta steineri]CAF1168089.1 unnamed protein product [Adineta steineri]CAF1299843.1 unnamed protein product [Adineta steineri]CAF1357371.1 unnamed protein product [Adineta steineri]CAF4072825.1 unnamed protein product [Adineta steineri]